MLSYHNTYTSTDFYKKKFFSGKSNNWLFGQVRVHLNFEYIDEWLHFNDDVMMILR